MANTIQIIIDAIDNASGPIGGINTVLSLTPNIALGVTGALGGALAGALIYSGNKAAEFEQVMSGVKAVSAATQPEMKGISDLALQLGKDTSFSAMEAGKGIEELVKGGLTIPDIMNGAAKSTLALAAAGGVSIPDAATIAANALAMFSLKGEDMARVADLIAGAANASAIDVGQFKYSLQAAGAIAATVGFSFDDLAQGIAVMGKAGIVGADAGTSLKTMMLNLQPQTKEQIKLFKDLGIVTKDGSNAFFDANGSVKSMADVSEVLQKSLKGMTDAQRTAALRTMFESDGMRAGVILAKEGAKGLNEMAASMGKVTAESVGATKLDNFKGSMDQLSGSVETLGIKFGLLLIPAMRWFSEKATEAVNSLMPLTDQISVGLDVVMDFANYLGITADSGDELNDVIVELPESMRGIAESVGKVVVKLRDLFSEGGALEPFLKGIQAMVSQKAALIGISVVLGGVLTIAAFSASLALWSMVAPLIPLIAVLATLGAAAYLLSVGWDNNFMGMRDIGEMLWKNFQAGFQIMTQVLSAWWAVAQPIVQAFMEDLSKFWTEISPKLLEVWNRWTTSIGKDIKLITEVVGNGLNAIKGAWDTNAGGIQTIVRTLWDFISGVFQLGWAIIKQVVSGGLSLLTGDWKGFFKAVDDGSTDFFTALDKAWTAFWKLLKFGVDLQLGLLKVAWDGALSYISGVITGFWNAITSSATTNFAAVTAEWGKITDAIGSLFTIAKESIQTAVSIAIDWVKWKAIDGLGAIQTAWDTIKEAVQGPLIDAKDAIGTAISTAIGWVVSKAADGLTSAQTAWDTIKEAVQKPLIAAKDAIDTAITTAISLVRDAPGNALIAIQTAWDKIKEAVQGPLINAKDAILGVAGEGGSVGAIDAIISKISGVGGTLLESIQTAWSAIGTAISKPFTDLTGSESDLMKAFASIKDSINAIIDAYNLLAEATGIPTIIRIKQIIDEDVTGASAESVVRRGFSNAVGSAIGAVQGVTVNVYVSGSVTSERDLTMIIREQLLTLKTANGSTGL